VRRPAQQRARRRPIAARAGWSERAVTKVVETYAHAVDERRLDEIDRTFERDANRERTGRASQVRTGT
jgi:hypothetical protein